MGESLYEQIAEEAKTLNLNEGVEDGQDDHGNDEGRGQQPVRRQNGQKRGEQSEQGEVSELGRAGKRRSSGEGASRSESGASSEEARDAQGTGRDPQGARGGAQEDAPASQEDGEEVLDTAPKTNADFAKQRRELRELKAKLAKLEAAQATSPAASSVPAVETKPASEANVEPSKEPDKNVNYQEWLEWKLNQNDTTIKEQQTLIKDFKDWREDQKKNADINKLYSDATQEFLTIEKEYGKVNPDYGNAIEFARSKYVDAAKLMYPDRTESQIEEATNIQMLKFASDCAKKGLNPAEELYDLAIERFGYTKTEAQEAVEDEEPPQRKVDRPNLNRIASNKRRSASPLSGGGQGGSIPITKEIAADMSIGEFSKLSPDELAMLENMG